MEKKQRFIAMGITWNEKAINYSHGVNITDYKTGKVYTQKEAEQQPKEIRMRLINKGKVIGCWVVKQFQRARVKNGFIDRIYKNIETRNKKGLRPKKHTRKNIQNNRKNTKEVE